MRAGGGSEQRSLHYYVERNDNRGLIKAIENGGDLEKRGGTFRETPLGAASRRGHVEAVEILVKALLSLEHRVLVALVRLLHGLVQCEAVHGQPVLVCAPAPERATAASICWAVRSISQRVLRGPDAGMGVAAVLEWLPGGGNSTGTGCNGARQQVEEHHIRRSAARARGRPPGYHNVIPGSGCK